MKFVLTFVVVALISACSSTPPAPQNQENNYYSQNQGAYLYNGPRVGQPGGDVNNLTLVYNKYQTPIAQTPVTNSSQYQHALGGNTYHHQERSNAHQQVTQQPRTQHSTLQPRTPQGTNRGYHEHQHHQ